MRKKRSLLIGMAILIVILRYLGSEIEFVANPVNKAAGKIVVIDPGHGGIDPGCSSKNGVLEKHLVLEISKKLEKKLNSYAIYTILTREIDTDLAPDVKGPLIRRKREDLNRRAALVKKHNADIFVSIHANSFPESKWSGAQTFYPPECGRSRLLAEAIQNSLVTKVGPNTRKAKPGDFRVLRESQVPSTMVEVGFLSNQKEAQLLQDPAYQDRLVDAIAKGIVDFFESGGASQVSAERVQPEVFVGPILKEDEVLVFFASTEDNGLLDYEKRTVSKSDPESVLRLLHLGPQNQRTLKALLETSSLTYIGKNQNRVYVTVDFGDTQITGHLEELAVYSVVNSLTSLSGIEEVIMEVIGSSEEFDWSKPLRFNSFLVKGKAEEY
jgi:N-acetylmuramoyl-L-alanine amidase